MPSRLMSVKEALEYARVNNLKGIRVEGDTLIYVNSIGKVSRVKIKPNMKVYYRGKGRWAVYSPERDAKIISHKISVPVKNKSAWQHYGDLQPEKQVNKEKLVEAKVGRGKGKKVKIKRKIPGGGGRKSL